MYLSSATSNLAHLDVGLDQLVASFVSQLGVERLLRIRLQITNQCFSIVTVERINSYKLVKEKHDNVSDPTCIIESTPPKR